MNRIKPLRKQKGVTVKDLAETLGISQSMMTNYENGSSTPRDESIWEKLAEYFGVTVSYLMGLTDSLQIDGKDGYGTPLAFIVVDTIRVQKEYIEARKPIEIEVSSVEEYALLANLAQLDNEDIKILLGTAQEIIRDKYNGRATEIRLSVEEE